MGRQRKVDDVIYGECIAYDNVAPFTFRPDRGGMRVWMRRGADGQMVFTASDSRRTDDNLDGPRDAIEDTAEEMVEGMKK